MYSKLIELMCIYLQYSLFNHTINNSISNIMNFVKNIWLYRTVYNVFEFHKTTVL